MAMVALVMAASAEEVLTPRMNDWSILRMSIGNCLRYAAAELPVPEAVRSTQLPMPIMSPASSASGTNADGGTLPSSDDPQRSSASAPEMRDEDSSTSGW